MTPSSCVVVLFRHSPAVYGPYTYKRANEVLAYVREEWPDVESHRANIESW